MDWLDINNPELRMLLMILIALGLGFVIGLEREHSSGKDGEEIFAGIRTFPLISILGFFAAFLGEQFSIWIFVGLFLGVAALDAISYYFMAKKGNIGGTTEVVILITFILGALIYLEYLLIASVTTVLLTVLLSFKPELHRFANKLVQEDIKAFIKFLIITVIILPILPDESMGPYDAINPRELWFLVVLISGLSFIGYILIRIIGSRRGVMATGILGGLISSTATSWDFSEKSKQHPDYSLLYAIGIVAASSIMFFRMLVVLLVVETNLAIKLIVPLGLLGLAGIVFCIFFYQKKAKKHTFDEELKIKNPLNLWNALQFSFFFALILIIVEFANREFGESGVYAASAISGLTDVDAITLTMAKMHEQQSMNLSAVITAIILAATSNTLVKYGIAMIFGHKNMYRSVTIGFGMIVAMGVLVALGYILIF